MLARIGEALDSEIVSLGVPGPMHLRVKGGTRLSGAIDVKSSKNAGVALLVASLLNKGRTTLLKVARIEEVNRLLEVLNSIGVRTRWLNDDNDLEIVPPATLQLSEMDVEAARRTRSIIMFLGPLMHREQTFSLPYAGGCDLGTRTVEPHMTALRHFGLEVKATEGHYHAEVDSSVRLERAIVLTERGDTVTENALMAAARYDGETVIRNASSNYMVQDLCFYLCELGVAIEGIGTTTLVVRGLPEIDVDVTYAPSEDPIEAMSLVAAAVVTESEITVQRVPIEFMEIELALLEEMGFQYDRTPEYLATNGRTRLVDIITHASVLHAPLDKIHPMPFPRAQHRQPAVLRDHRRRCERVDAAPRLGLREPRHLPHRAEQARRHGQAAGPAPGADRGPDPLARRRGDLPARPCGRRWSSCSPCWRPRARRCCAACTSSTAGTRISPSG
jgi:UDP-N-acetylglucosamine 1-carboxyvinyltransferase